jgi:hypothetical protein
MSDRELAALETIRGGAISKPFQHVERLSANFQELAKDIIRT